MMSLLALALIMTDPAPLPVGPDEGQPRQVRSVVVHEERAYRDEGSFERYRHERAGVSGSRAHFQSDESRPLRAGDPVTLNAGFFHGPLTGGVGDEPPRIIVVRQNGHSYYRWR